VVAHDQVGQVVPVDGADVLLLVRFIDIVALGPTGILWRSERLAVDDLIVVDTRPDAIVCTRSMAMLGGGVETITLDPATGVLLQGGRLGEPSAGSGIASHDCGEPGDTAGQSRLTAMAQNVGSKATATRQSIQATLGSRDWDQDSDS